jgi:hypothetical protein
MALRCFVVQTEQIMEGLAASLITAKKRGVVGYEGHLLSQSVHKAVVITLLKTDFEPTPVAAAVKLEGGTSLIYMAVCSAGSAPCDDATCRSQNHGLLGHFPLFLVEFFDFFTSSSSSLSLFRGLLRCQLVLKSARHAEKAFMREKKLLLRERSKRAPCLDRFCPDPYLYAALSHWRVF